MGRGKKQTIGHNYYLGLHLVMARQIDALLQIKMASKVAWTGMLSSGRGTINKPQLFGGDKREGGFSGSFDLLDGNNNQPINDYLAEKIGSLASAYRGVVSMVWRSPNIGANSARLPSMEFKLANFVGVHRGWEVSKAVVGVEAGGGGASIYIALDATLSMTGVRLNAAKAALAALVRSFKGTVNSIRVVAFSDVISGSIERFDCSDNDYEDIAVWLEAFDNLQFGGNWTLALASAPTFFTTDASLVRNLSLGNISNPLLDSLGVGGISTEARRKIIVFLTDGEPTPITVAPAIAIRDSIPGVELFAFHLDSGDLNYANAIDNTPLDGVPAITGGDTTALFAAFASAIFSWADMNPAHIIRCLWTDPMRGGVASEDEIGDSFAEAAQLFYDEGFGLSVPFRGADMVEADRLEIERHVDAISYRSRRTGKIEIKPIRSDYNPEDLPILNSSIVLEWSGLDKAMRSETPNQLTVVYTKRDNGEAASVTRTNTAGVRRAGRIIPGEPSEYPFITKAALATRVCLRDLSVQDRPLLTGTLRLAYLPPDLEIGEPFIINEPTLHINNVVVRIMNSQEGSGSDASVLVSIAEDRYAMPLLGDAGAEEIIPPIPVIPRAEPISARIVQETPYYMMVLDQGQDAVDSALLEEPDLGTLLVTGIKPTSSHFNITPAVDSGAGYEADDDVNFAVASDTLSLLVAQADATTVTVAATPELATITVNSLAIINDEIVRIDDFVTNGSNIDVVIGRGCLDTVPARHVIGSKLVFLQAADPLEVQYVAPDSVDVKLLSNMNEDRLSLPSAPSDTVTFDSRAIRPYPPGQFKLNGSYDQDQYYEDMTLTWVHRDRIIQTTLVPEDHDDASIGPEAGTTYKVKVEAFDSTNALLSTLMDTDVGLVTSYDWDDDTELPTTTASVRFTITSVRDGYESWQSPSINAVVLMAPIITGIETI